MQRYCFSALLLGGLACYSVALPQELRATPAIFERSADASSTSSAPAVVSSDVESIDRKKNEKICVQYYPEQGNPTDPNNPLSVQQQCMNICGNATQKTEDDGQMHSVACISFNQPWCDATSGKPKPLDYQPQPGDDLVMGGNCTCDSQFLNMLAETFIEALPAIANIGCTILMGAVGLVAEIGLAAIPGVGEAIDGGMIAGIQAAKLADYTYDAASDAADAFSNWLNPCGTEGVPDGLSKVFGIMSGVPNNRLPKGFNPPKGVKPGSGKPGDKGDPSPKKSNPVSKKPTQSAAPSKPTNSAPARTTKPNNPTTKPNHATTTPSRSASKSTEPTHTTNSKKQKTRTGTGTGTGTASFGPNPSNGSEPAQYRLQGKLKARQYG